MVLHALMDVTATDATIVFLDQQDALLWGCKRLVLFLYQTEEHMIGATL